MAAGIPPRGAPGNPPDRSYPGPGNRAQVYLHAGQLHAARSPTAITTILGSCVSVCLFDPEAAVGGMNHFLLPHHVERERSPRFGTVAVPELVEAVLRAGARRSGLKAKVFGGACVIQAFRGSRCLGDENARLALRLLEESGVTVLDVDVGGQRGRKLVFHSDQGTAWVRKL
jgi:chemotaxis protein CheD